MKFGWITSAGGALCRSSSYQVRHYSKPFPVRSNTKTRYQSICYQFCAVSLILHPQKLLHALCSLIVLKLLHRGSQWGHETCQHWLERGEQLTFHRAALVGGTQQGSRAEWLGVQGGHHSSPTPLSITTSIGLSLHFCADVWIITSYINICYSSMLNLQEKVAKRGMKHWLLS